MAAPRYNQLVQNRTDLFAGNGGVLQYTLAKSPWVDPYPPSNYKGEVIPPFAVMRVCGQATLWKGELCYPVCRPDDISQEFQINGLHFINGPTPIPLMGYARATNDLPAPMLVDLTARQDPYSGTTVPSINTLIGVFFGYMSGTWALHAADDIISANGDLVNMVATFFPYTVLSQDPYPDPDNPGEYLYRNGIYWIGGGGKGFASVTTFMPNAGAGTGLLI